MFPFVFRGINSNTFGTTWRVRSIIAISHMTNSNLSFQLEFLFKWYHIEKMKHIVQDLSSDIDWLELEYSVKSTEGAFLSESMENPTLWQVWGQEVTRPLFYGNTCERGPLLNWNKSLAISKWFICKKHCGILYDIGHIQVC